MSRIAAAFEKARAEKRAALITYVCAGDPSLKLTSQLVPQLAACGADVIELGVPFSDPLADGPVIQAASQRALDRGTTPQNVIDQVKEIRSAGCAAPIVLMGYLNPLVARGIDRFCADAAAAGVDGLIVPDLSLDEADEVAIPAAQRGLDLILLAAPTTPAERLARIAQKSRGFLYYVSVTGVTGARGALPSQLPDQLRAARSTSPVPVAVGFGVSTPAQAAELGQLADGVIVGSALVRALDEGRGDVKPALELVRGLAAALKRG